MAGLRNVSVERWLRRLPTHGLAMARAWLAVLDKRVAGADLSEACFARLRRLMVEDVRAQLVEIEECAGASGSSGSGMRAGREWSAYVHAWVAFYPQWSAARLCELEAAEPELFVSEVAARAAQSARDRALNGALVRQRRDAATGRKLLALLAARDGVIRWEPDKVARALSPHARGNLPDVARMAKSLVRLGVAEWQTTPSGKPWALVARSEQP